MPARAGRAHAGAPSSRPLGPHPTEQERPRVANDRLAPPRRSSARRRGRRTGGARAADVFVAFGITGDLAKVMTFRSLYRLERRGLLHCPILGVAADDWDAERLRAHARAAIEGTGEEVDDEVFARFAARLSYVSGDFGDPATYERVRDAVGDAVAPVFYLEIPPFLFGRAWRACPAPG